MRKQSARNRAVGSGLMLLVAIVAAACSGQHSTEPGDTESARTFPALPVTEVPVLYASNFVGATSGSDSTIALELVFPNDLVSTFNEPFDIVLYVTQAKDHLEQALEVYDYTQSGWLVLVPRVSIFDCWTFNSSSFLLSCFGDNLKKRFLGPENVLRVRGEVSSAQAQLLQYNQDFVFLAFPPIYNNYPAGLCSVGDHVWVAVRYIGCDPDNGTYSRDSVFILDTNGFRQGFFTIPSNLNVQGLTEGNGVVWALYDSGKSIGTVDASGVIRRAFSLPASLARISSMVWAMDRLWIMDAYVPGLYGIRTDLSIDSGFAVIDTTLSIPWDYNGAMGPLAWSGSHFYVVHGTDIAKIDSTGTAVTGYTFPFRDSFYTWRLTRLITWHSESIWAFHQELHWGVMPYVLSRIRMP